jgi:hypothetical protein
MGKIHKAKEKVKKAKHKVARTVRPGFWKHVLLALTPKTYSELSSKKIRDGVKYIFALLFASFIIMCILALPRIAAMPNYIETELSKFDKLNISIEMETSSPVRITGEDPQIMIDAGADAAIGDEKLLITGDQLIYRPYGIAKTYNISEYSDVTAKKQEISRLMTLLVIILIPTILITSYIMFLVKYIITIIVLAVLLFIALRMMKKELSFFKSLNVAIYAATPMILLEIIFIPFNSNYLYSLFQFMGMNYYAITLGLYVLLAGFGSYFAMKNPKSKKDKEEYPTVEGIQWDF